MKMRVTDEPPGYWTVSEPYATSPTRLAVNISKSAWMDLYYDLFLQTHGQHSTSQKLVVADARERLKILIGNGLRRR